VTIWGKKENSHALGKQRPAFASDGLLSRWAFKNNWLFEIDRRIKALPLFTGADIETANFTLQGPKNTNYTGPYLLTTYVLIDTDQPFGETGEWLLSISSDST
jgi:hypothetical protein